MGHDVKTIQKKKEKLKKMALAIVANLYASMFVVFMLSEANTLTAVKGRKSQVVFGVRKASNAA